MEQGGQTTWQGILLNQGYLSIDAIERIEREANETHSDPLDVLFASGDITKSLFGQAIAEYYQVPFADLNAHPPTSEHRDAIPEHIAREDRCVLFFENDTEVIFATDQPNVPLGAEYTEHFPGKALRVAYALPEDIDVVLGGYRKPLDTRFAKILEGHGKAAMEMIDEIMVDAMAFRASDIHFEPNDTDVLIRFRVDGILHEAGRLSKDVYENIVNRIKVQAHLRTDQHFSTQDGAIRSVVQGENVDIRVSIVPLVDGEKIVFRLLSEYMRRFQLSDLGLSLPFQKNFIDAANKPFGMILVVGPTGSGKTTSLYAAVKLLNHSDVNISTIEDPVEYKIPGVNHIQVNTQTDLTFGKGLRSIVRQDPDIILVGEIRDQETMDIALNAALTGHMLLSTFHANDAAAAIPRMMDMGAEPFLLSSAIELIIAQRLVRKICVSCRYSVEVTKAQFTNDHPKIAQYFPGDSVRHYLGKGCAACGMTGYKGRIGIFELIVATPELRESIMHRPSAMDILAIAQNAGMKPMFFDGLDKVLRGVTSLEELQRNAVPPDAYVEK
jgi:type IV pilus assembly protein PilB